MGHERIPSGHRREERTERGDFQPPYGYGKRWCECLAEPQRDGERTDPFPRFRYLRDTGRVQAYAGRGCRTGGLLDGYAYIGAGRDDGEDAGEHSAIFYKTSRFDLLDKGNFWFSETPDVPGKGWDATSCNRICSWGKFRDKESGKVFYFFNSHYDHQGKVARRESSKLLIARIKQIAGTDATVFATGDFNAVPTDEPMVTLASDGLLLDSYDLSEQPRYGTEGTYNSFKTDSEMKNRIDYIWVTKGTKVKKYAVLNDMQYGRFPSDHFPVMIQVTF